MIGIFWSKVWSLLISKRLAAFTIILLTVTISAAAVFSQSAPFTGKQADLFNRFYLSGWFIMLIIILFLNTLACTIQQMKILNKTNGEFFKQDTLSGKTDNTFPVYRQEAKKLNQLIINFLTNKGLAYSYNDNVYRIEKNQWGKYSSIVFHISLLIMLLGFAADALLRMEGTIVLTEGQTRMEQHAAYAYLREAPFYNEADHGKFAITLQALEIKYPPQGVPDDYSSKITLSTADGVTREALVTKSQPAYLGAVSLHQEFYGYAPAVVIKDKTGKLLLESYVNIGTIPHPTSHAYQDSVTVPGTDLKFWLTFFPDLREKGDYITGSYRPVKPGLQIRVTQGKQVLYSGYAAIGESVGFGKYQVSFPELRRWSAIKISRDLGVPLVYTGFWLAVAGLMMLYLLVPQKIYIYLQYERDYTKVIIEGRSRRYPQRFSELLAELTGELTGELESFLKKENSEHA